MSDQPRYIPFTNAEEMLSHIDISMILLERLRSTVELMDKSEGDKRDELANHITKSLSVLNDGFVNMILSIEQYYISVPTPQNRIPIGTD